MGKLREKAMGDDLCVSLPCRPGGGARAALLSEGRKGQRGAREADVGRKVDVLWEKRAGAVRQAGTMMCKSLLVAEEEKYGREVSVGEWAEARSASRSKVKILVPEAKSRHPTY